MGSTIDDVSCEIMLEEEWKRERNEAFKILEEIANSENISQLQNNLDRLKEIYISDLAIDDENIGQLMSKLDFSMPKFKEDFDYKYKKSEKSQKLYFLITLLIAILAIFICFVP